ncbi:MAG: CRISPR-associated endonuclease Cas1 [Pirellula sp.]
MITPSPTPSPDEDYLPARMLNEFAYCPRLFYLEHVDGLFAHNADTIEGAARHQRVDQKTTELPPVARFSESSPRRSRKPSTENNDTAESESAQETAERETVHARSVTLASERHRILAKLDLVESDGRVATPVDYKRGSPKKLDDGSLGAWDPERVQICVQALVLRENGFQCDEGVLFFWETRQRVRIAIDDELIALTESVIEGARHAQLSDIAPPPLVDSPKCPRCSLVGICMPDETSYCRDTPDNGSLQQPMLFDIGPSRLSVKTEPPVANQRIRQMVTARDERKPLYLNSQGITLGKSGDVLQAREKGKLVQEFRLHDVSQVNVMGNVQISTQAVQGLLMAEIPLVYFSYGGWFYGLSQGMGLKNIVWRREQFRCADRPEFCLRFARKLVSAKIQNQRTLLMRNHVEPSAGALQMLKSMKWEAERADSLQSLLGIEGLAARYYFEQFGGMIKANRETDEDSLSALECETRPGQAWLRFDFEGRNRRPPRDPVNAMLSLGYSLLAKDLAIACTSVGLDPYMGYYHQPRFGRASLALDLMEPFRPLVVDSTVITAINNRMIAPEHFVSAGDAVALTPNGRKSFFRAYEQRMDQLVTHPLFDYRVSYRRMLEIQTRLLARCLTGEIWDYPTFVTR